MTPGIEHGLVAGIVAVSIVLMLTRPRGIAEVYWIGGGVAVLLALRLEPLRSAAHAVARGTDVYLFLTGMMLLSELAREQGVFDWVAARAVGAADGSGTRLFTLVYGVGTLVTLFLSNDATAVVLTPAILQAVRRARVKPLPCLFACAMVANAASFVLPISNPANLVVFHKALPPLGRWLADFLVPSLLSIAATYGVLRWVFRDAMRERIQDQGDPIPLSRPGRWVLGGLAAVVVILLVVSGLGIDLGLPTCLAAVTVTAVVCWSTRSSPAPLLKQISWSTLALVAGLFVMVDAAERIGALRAVVTALHSAERLGPNLGAMAAAFTVGVANNLVNNLPVGLIAGAALEAAKMHGLLANAVLIGVDLGPNLSVTGSLATILWLIALRREGQNVSFGHFLRVGLIAMPVALAAAVGGALLMQHL